MAGLDGLLPDVYALTGGPVWTGVTVMPGGTVLVRDGCIAACGPEAATGLDVPVIDVGAAAAGVIAATGPAVEVEPWDTWGGSAGFTEPELTGRRFVYRAATFRPPTVSAASASCAESPTTGTPSSGRLQHRLAIVSSSPGPGFRQRQPASGACGQKKIPSMCPPTRAKAR